MILVTGASGQFGKNAIDHLLKKGNSPAEIAVLVRDKSKAKSFEHTGVDVRVGDYTDYDSLLRALKGISKLLLVSSNDRQAVENRTAQHINVIKAAKDAGVGHIFYTSFVRKPGFENSAIAAFQNSHVESEEFLKNSGVKYTILQNGIYLEMVPVFAGEKVVDSGVILFPASEGKASFVLREELAEVAAGIIASEGHENKTYNLTNTSSVSFAEVAEAISATIDKKVIFQSPEVTEFQSTLKQFGVPEMYIGMFTMWATAVAQNTMDVEDDTLKSFLGRNPTTLQQFINSVYAVK
ncbi:SDR family oxidoreductase [Mucilaginibacter terrae]|uniref:SDR family oxidoreductase n=1 Tax=Mucilaginibacter terrae TaxID=1955052 RepID=UPI00363721B2